MADKKRKTLQIRRPDKNSPNSKKKPLPKVKVDEKAATSSVENDEISSLGPKAAKVTQSDDSSGVKRGQTTRVNLPDEDKIRKARRANSTQDLGEEDSLPSAEQIAHAQKNATMPIMIDTESVEDDRSNQISDTDDQGSLDKTMEIDDESLATANIEDELSGANSSKGNNDQTMEIDPMALETGDVEKTLNEASTSKGSDKDQTMQIDPAALATGNIDELMDDDQSDTAGNDQTMEIDPESLSTGENPSLNEDEIMSNETMKMDPFDDEESPEEATAKENTPVETKLTVEEMKESFNAQTMEMDAATLAKEIEKKNTAEISSEAVEEDERSQTMDLSSSRPKTIMIKRPSKKSPSSSSTPTVKAVRPDAATVRAPRPVTANTAKAKEDTSRIDVPGQSIGGREGKTIKLRRPSGGPGSRSNSTLSSRLSKDAGITLNEDGSVSSTSRKTTLGTAWLAVAIVTLLLSLGAIYSLAAHSMAELPMPGRLVDVNQQLIQ